jgi:hypothetical protein
MSVSCECCVLSGRGLCVGPIARPEESYTQCGVSECDHDAWMMRRPWPTRNCCAIGKKYMYMDTYMCICVCVCVCVCVCIYIYIYIYIYRFEYNPEC